MKISAAVLSLVFAGSTFAYPQQQQPFQAPDQQQLQEFQDTIGQLVSLFPAEMANVSFPLSMDDGEMRCWKTFRPDTSNSDSHCTVGYEYSHGRCYVPCRGGYKAWGQFCFAASDAQSEVKSYQRDLAPSEQQGVSTELISKLGQCPSAIPFDCGLICVDSAGTCRKEGIFFTFVLVKFGQLIANGNYVGAVMLGKQLFDRISRWPKCKEFGNNGAADNAQLSDQLGQLLQMFGQMH